MQDGTGRKGRVLIAEDVRGVAESLAGRCAAGLRRRVCRRRVCHASSARSAEMPVDLVVLDILLPGLGGAEVMRRLREEGRTVGFIVCTAKSFKTEQDRVAELGAFAMMAKPFQPALLVQIVDDYFAAHGSNGGNPHIIRGGTSGEIFRPELQSHRGYFTLWGTRGSVPTPGAQFLRHGGQTSCMQVTLGDERVILDAGSGIRNLGLELAHSPPAASTCSSPTRTGTTSRDSRSSSPRTCPGSRSSCTAPRRSERTCAACSAASSTATTFPCRSATCGRSSSSGS